MHIASKAFNSFSFACLWKLLAEALLTMHALPNDIALLQVPSSLLNIQKEEKTSIDKLQTLQLATKSLLRALKIQPENVSCWQDLALCYFHRFSLNSEEDELKDNSLNAIRKALALKPKDAGLWNILGVFALHYGDFALAQHAFIRSIGWCSNSMAWANLGILYFMQARTDLANKAFKEAQNVDPTYLQGWIGQALLAETAGYGEEAIDLFRHCTYLGHGYESALGYAHWICQTLQEMAQEDAIANAADGNQAETALLPGKRKKHNRY